MDPLIRSRMYKKEGLLPFHQFLKQQMKLQARVNTPRTKPAKNIGEKFTDWRVGDLCLVSFSKNALQRSFQPKRGKIMRIHRILTNYTPYVFELSNISDNTIEKGYFSGKYRQRKLCQN